jgi:hypothetical protein
VSQALFQLEFVIDVGTIGSEHRHDIALDAARGMRFLHTQTPARVHRDFKVGELAVVCTEHDLMDLLDRQPARDRTLGHQGG